MKNIEKRGAASELTVYKENVYYRKIAKGNVLKKADYAFASSVLLKGEAE